MIKSLIEHGYNPMQTDNFGCSALHIAALWNKAESLKVMLEFGLDLEVMDVEGQTPLHWAAKSGNGVDVIEVLVEVTATVPVGGP